jgi:hypothetical protein
MTLHERLKAEEDNVLDRRRISEESERELAEYIHHGDVELALDKLFRVLTGDVLADHEPYRSVGGLVSITDSLAENESVVVEITLGDETTRQIVDADSEFTFREITDGSYPLDATAIELREYDTDGFEYTATAIKSHTTTMDDSVTVDTTQTEIGQPVTTSTIEIGSIELEDTA